MTADPQNPASTPLKLKIARICLTCAAILFFMGFLLLCSCPGWHILTIVFCGISASLGTKQVRNWAILCIAFSAVMVVLDMVKDKKMKRSALKIRQLAEARRSQQTNQPIQFAGIFLTNFGTLHPEGSVWTVQVDATSRIASASHEFTMPAIAGAQTGKASITAPKWEAQPGWFAYIDSAESVWLYDGVNELCVLECLPEGGTRIWGLTTYPSALPDEVRTRLSKDALDLRARK